MEFFAVLALGAVAILAFGSSLASLVTGISYWRPDVVKRKDDPLSFWLSVITHFAMGLFISAMIVAMMTS